MDINAEKSVERCALQNAKKSVSKVSHVGTVKRWHVTVIRHLLNVITTVRRFWNVATLAKKDVKMNVSVTKKS